MTATRPLRPADGLLHPLALGVLALLVVNDHVLKAMWPGPVTGKASDLAGLVLFPLLLQGAVETVQALRGRWTAPSDRLLLGVAVLTGIAFAATQVWTPAGDAYQLTWGVLQWPLHGFPTEGPARVLLTADPTDLVALPALCLVVIVQRQRRWSRCPKRHVDSWRLGRIDLPRTACRSRPAPSRSCTAYGYALAHGRSRANTAGASDIDGDTTWVHGEDALDLPGHMSDVVGADAVDIDESWAGPTRVGCPPRPVTVA